MVFHSPAEVFTAYAEGKLGVHARIRVRLPIEKKVISEVKDEKGEAVAEELPRKAERPGHDHRRPGHLQRHPAPEDGVLRPAAGVASTCSRIIADCYQLLGRRETIALLDRMKETGFRESTRSRACRSPPATCGRRRTRRTS